MIRKQTPEEQIAKMQHLINFGVNEDTTRASVPVVEFKKKAANGKTYGIIRDTTKYYIMEAPEKDTEILAEDFDYIGGFNNRKENEFNSYSKASNALDLKIMAINETVSKENRVPIEAPKVKADWENSITESMRKEIDRFNTITTNVSKILKEDKGIGSVPSEHTLPEAPAQNPSDKKVNAPFTQSGVAKGEKDFKKEEHNHETAGTPFDKNGEVSNKDMESDKMPKGHGDDTYNEKPKYGNYGITTEHPSGGKVVRVNEGNGHKIRLKLTEEQVLAWNDNKDYMDMSHGTHVGSSDPFDDELGKDSNQTEANTDPIREGNGDSFVYDHPKDQSSPTPGTTDVETEDGDPYIEIISEDVDFDDAAGFDELDDTEDVPFPEVESDEDLPETNDDDWYGPDEDDDIEIEMDSEKADADRYNNRGMKGLENWEETWNQIDDDDDEYLYEKRNRRKRLSEDKLNVFGKHPAWRKQPMTTPPNKEVAINGAREWDDESAQGEEPYAKQIGDSSPFNEIVKQVSESLIKRLYGRKKKR